EDVGALMNSGCCRAILPEGFCRVRKHLADARYRVANDGELLGEDGLIDHARPRSAPREHRAPRQDESCARARFRARSTRRRARKVRADLLPRLHGEHPGLGYRTPMTLQLEARIAGA